MIRYLWRYYINTDIPTERQSGGLYFTANYSRKKMSNTDINKKAMKRSSIFTLTVKELFFSFQINLHFKRQNMKI